MPDKGRLPTASKKAACPAWKLQVTLKGPPRVPRALSQVPPENHPHFLALPRIADKELAIKQLAKHSWGVGKSVAS